jgi:ribosomal protein S12 methylthiotransferase accessory factor
VLPNAARFGITRLADVTGLDTIGLPVVLCIRPNARHLSVSQGKGVDIDLATVSALMESIELHHAELQPVGQVRCAFRAHAAGRAIDPASLPPGPRRRAMAEGPLTWVEGLDLLTGAPVFIPQAAVFLDSSTVHEDQGVLSGSTNGLASGNTETEAVLHALYEVVERDSDARFDQLSADEQAEREIDLTSIRSPMLCALVSRFEAAPVHVAVWDVTGPTNIPAYRCVVREPDTWRPLGAHRGSGCHLSPEVALSRAMTEAAQARMTVITGSREDLPNALYAHAPHPGARPPPPASHAPRDFRHRESEQTATWQGDLDLVLERLASLGFGTAARLDYTRPEDGIPVVHLVVPGLQAAL